ncbi:unnamed protein product [Oikopleura dioica]|uniref:Uncharacterized protein n=1 Tax=Oikopleura dioica TaxID=34765 RepID=E4XWR3_OIKDI|nr:unnamed protein product [Oikopleura dioica]
MTERDKITDESQAILRYVHTLSKGQIRLLLFNLRMDPKKYCTPDLLPPESDQIAELEKETEENESDSDDFDDIDKFEVRPCKKKSFDARQREFEEEDYEIGRALIVTILFDCNPASHKCVLFKSRKFIVYEWEEDDEPKLAVESLKAGI